VSWVGSGIGPNDPKCANITAKSGFSRKFQHSTANEDKIEFEVVHSHRLFILPHPFSSSSLAPRSLSNTFVMSDRYKIIVYVPVSHAEAVKNAGPSSSPFPSKSTDAIPVFDAGAGTIGNYSRVSFTTPGTSSFLPSSTSTPAIGTPGEVEVVQEVRIEVTAVGRDVVKRAVEGVRKVHPYEEVVVDVYRLEDF
jgi:hypothetical protein